MFDQLNSHYPSCPKPQYKNIYHTIVSLFTKINETENVRFVLNKYTN